jgi:transcriptional regulator with XRE-family HTH domain
MDDGHTLRVARLAAEISQQVLATRCNVSRELISAVENGRRRATPKLTARLRYVLPSTADGPAPLRPGE